MLINRDLFIISFLSIPNLMLIIFNNNYYFDFFLNLIFILNIIIFSRYYFVRFLIYFYFFLIPFYMYFLIFYKKFLDENIFSVIFESNYDEIMSFLNLNYILLSFLYFILISIFFMRVKFKLNSNVKDFFLIMVLNILVVIVCFSKYLDFKDNYNIDDSFHVADLKYKEFFENIYISNFLISFLNYINFKKYMNEVYSRNNGFHFNPYFNNKGFPSVILIIGESSRANNFEVNGYYRDTNPKLMMERNLVSFNNMISLTTFTRKSIPFILTRKSENMYNSFYFNEKTIISLFNEAGYNTYWLSNQLYMGAIDTSTSTFANEAKYKKFYNMMHYEKMGNYDDIILPDLKIIANRNEKKFIVIHLMGSHFPYNFRYPDSFDRFKPSIEKGNIIPLTKLPKDVAINSYDNSVLFTDYVLSSVIKSFENKETLILYVSDHGESLFDGKCDSVGHGGNSIEQFRISSFIWYSDLYKKNYPEKISWLEKNKNRRINQTSVFPTLADAANLSIPNDPLNRSLLKNFKDYPRIVNGNIDFDKTKPKGICKEIL